MSHDIETALQRALAQTTHPSKRSVKNKSGRTGRKQANGRASVKAVGGYANSTYAIYVPADKELCVVVEREVKAVGTFSAPAYEVPQGRHLGRVGCV